MTDEIMYWGEKSADPACIRSVPWSAYPSGEPLVQLPRGARPERLLLRPKSVTGFLAGLFMVDAMTDRGLPIPELILPFVPGSRQDRLNNEGDYLFTAKSVARMINDRNFPKVTILDPHSEVISALINRCYVVHPYEYFPKWNYSFVISPDAGAEKRAGLVAKKLGIPLVHAWKTRDVKTGAITGFGMEPVAKAKDAFAIVVDDICDGGGTFVGLADVLERAFVRADLYVSHGLFSQGVEKLLDKYDHVYCTDSVLPHKPTSNTFFVCEQLLRGESIVT